MTHQHTKSRNHFP